MAYFPLFISLEGLPCLVIGGGRVALRKIRTLSEFGAQITVVAPEILPELEALSGLRLIRRRFEEKDLEHMSLVFAASSDQECNRKAARLARKKGIRVNAADLPEECDFFFPALGKRGGCDGGNQYRRKKPGGCGRGASADRAGACGGFVRVFTADGRYAEKDHGKRSVCERPYRVSAQNKGVF